MKSKKSSKNLENLLPNLFHQKALENIRNIYNFKSDSLSEYISTIVKYKEFSTLFYISFVYNSCLIAQNHSELIDLHNTTSWTLENKQEDVVSHFCNVLNIVQIHPQLLKTYLEIALFLANTHSNLLWPHLQNIYDSDPDSFKEYILKTSAIKKTQEPLIIHICNTFNIYRIKKQHPSLLQLYQSTSEALKNHPKSLSYHIYNTYRISILLTQYLHRYLTVVQKIVPVWVSQDEPKCLWLNTHLQSIQGFSFEDANALRACSESF